MQNYQRIEFLEMNMVRVGGEYFSRAHGTPFDRGSADRYYGRGQEPHWYPNGTYNGPKVTSQDMTMAELRAYFAGWESETDRKEWN